MTRFTRFAFVGLSSIFAFSFLGMAYTYRNLEGTLGRDLSVLAACCGIAAIVFLLIPGPRQFEVPDLEIEGAREPTYRLICVDKGHEGEVWNFVLGRSECVLIGPNGSKVKQFDRRWAGMAIKFPGFTRGEHLGIVKETLSPPEDPSRASAGQLLSEIRKIRGPMDRNVECFWFHADKRLIPIVRGYLDQSPAVLGTEAVEATRHQARSIVRTGLFGLIAGVAILLLAVGFVENQPGRRNSKMRMIALGSIIMLVGAWRAGHGFLKLRKADSFP